MSDRRLSVIIPTLNERGNIEPLVTRLAQALNGSGVTWEAIFIDDHSTDGTFQQLERMVQAGFPIHPYLKVGKRGKAYSLLEGFARAKYDAVAILDADLQCPPEAIGSMFEHLSNGVDVVVANRQNTFGNPYRRLASWIFQEVFAHRLNGLQVDSQSGLKLFRRQVLESVTLSPSPWTFDMEFLLKAQLAGYAIRGCAVDFSERTSGKSKINLWNASIEIVWNALSLWYQHRLPVLSRSMRAGLLGKGRWLTGLISNRRPF